MTALLMTSHIFPDFLTNPIQTLHRLKEAGFTEKQAEIQVEMASEIAKKYFEHVEATTATKRDLKEMEHNLKRDMRETELRFEARFKEIDAKFKEIDARFRESEMRLTIRMGAITSSVVGFFYILERFF